MKEALKEIRMLPETEVIRRWAELYAAGKHHGYAPPSAGQYVGRDSTWIEVEVPHDLYNADWNSEEANLSSAQTARAERYARTPGPLPPGMAGFKGKRGQRRLYVSDGNHRAYAAFLRGYDTARFYVPLVEWRRFQNTLSQRKETSS
jgi:hypothetical protein